MNSKRDYLNALLGFAVFYLLFSLMDLFGTSVNLGSFYTFLLTALIGGLFLFFILYLFVFKNTGVNEKIDFYGQNINEDLILGGVIGLLLGGIGLLSIFMKGNGIFSLFSFEYLKDNILPGGVVDKILFIAVFVFFIPVIEEYYFRGFMFSAFYKEFCFTVGVIVAAIFSSVYLSGTISFLYLFISDIVYSLLREKTKGIAAGTIAHILGNLIIIFAVIIKGGS